MSIKPDMKMLQDQPSVTMLLDNERFPYAISPTPSSLNRRRVAAGDPADKERDGVLGFDIFSTPASRSKVDLETWNAGNSDATSNSSNSGLVWNSNAQKDIPTSSSPRLSTLPAWFPWIPTKSQIGSLKVNELKEACGQRGLLKDRLWRWTMEQQQEHQAKITGEFLTNWFEGDMTSEDTWDSMDSGETKSPNSLEEWSRTVDLDDLREKRREIHRQKRQGRPSPKKKSAKPVQTQKEYLQELSKVLEAPSSPYSSNVKSKELYVASKKADQMGDRKTAIHLLHTLLEVTPSDGRVYRRLSRMYCEQGNVDQARSIMHKGIRRQPDNPWLWHGLAKLEHTHGGSKDKVRRLYQRAIQVDPAFAHSYHALGTFEHTEGNIAEAMKILKKGIEFCPTNHRLHHALGDLYRGAKLLEDAERSYRRSLEHGTPVNYCFAYSALACVAYERDQIANARKWLRRSIQLNNGRHARGWVSLAQLEESQGNIEEARSVCANANAQYERGLLEMGQRYQKQPKKQRIKGGDDEGAVSHPSNPLAIKNLLLKSVPKYRSGDKFLSVYLNWIRLEERYGTFESVDEVYARASVAFPFALKLTMSWANYHAKMHNFDRARSLYVDACNKASSRHAEPFRAFAELEMSAGNYGLARKILFRGAQDASKSADGGLHSRRGLAELFHTWAVCEWYLGNLPRSEVLFDHALCLTDSGEPGCKLRSFILYSIARLEFYQGEYLLAQHCVGLCMKENAMPGGKSLVWELWADVALAMGNSRLEDECRRHARYDRKKDNIGSSSFLDSALEDSGRSLSGIDRFSFRQDPWQVKLFGIERTKNSDAGDFYTKVKFPSRVLTTSERSMQICDF
eukprot:scaffold818_cov136-Cylindrotheca_fusiformis.AAC.21